MQNKSMELVVLIINTTDNRKRILAQSGEHKERDGKQIQELAFWIDILIVKRRRFLVIQN